MKKIIKKFIRFLLTPFVIKDFFVFKMLDKKSRFSLSFFDFHPQIKDKTIKTGFDRHYVYHTAWAARKLYNTAPKLHIDISSSLYFSAIVSAFVPVKFYDYRPADLVLNNLECLKGDLLQLPFEDNSVMSLSCMHVVEHVGMGRYGEPIDPDGDLKAIFELKRVLSPGGDLFFVVPVGGNNIMEFNAHRIYTPDLIKEYFKDLQLVEFALIKENSGGLLINPEKEEWQNEKYACGCFWFRKQIL